MSRRGGRNKQISPVDDDACLLQRIKNTKKGRPGWLPVAATATSTTKNGASLMIIFFGFSVLLTGRLALKKSASSSSNLAHTTYQAQSVVQDVQFCLHQGQCPIGSACGPSGICQPYHPFNRQPELPEMKYVRREKGRLRSGSIDQRRMDECVQYCVEELTVDEEFRFGSTPIIRTSYSAVAPHFGCVLEFERPKRGQRNMTTTRPTLEESLARRFRSVVRVDPIMSSFAHQRNHSRYTEMQENNSRGLWRAYCHAPCKQSSVDDSCPKDYDCLPRKWYRLPQNSTNPNSFPDRCQPKVRNSQDMSSAMVIVTGSDSGYFTGLVNFAASLRYWAPATRFLVYNLGMTPEELEQVKRWPNLLDIKWRDGIPSHYPSHVSWSDLQNYAWKPLAINESVHEYRNIFWLDAGASIVGPLDSVQEVIERNGIFLAQGQDEHMKYRSHSGM